MARLFPSRLPSHVESDPRRAAERKVYAALGKLDDSYTVLYAVPMLVKRPDDRARDGEMDFLIGHADRGLLALEIKGGRVRRDGSTGKWTSTDRNGVTHEIDDPVAQVRSAKYALMQKIKDCRDWGNRWVEIGHGVSLPDCARPTSPLTPDFPPDIGIFAEDLDGIVQRVPAIFDYWQGRQERPFKLGQDGLSFVVERFAPSFQLRMPLGPMLVEDDRKLLELTEGQFGVLGMLARQRRVSVIGGAGSGKTMLAVEKAKRLAAEGFRVLLTCYNRPLADFLRRSVGSAPNLEVSSFHQLCFAFAQEARISLASPGDEGSLTREYFERTLPDALEQALSKVKRRYDAILVDEGQDFLESWWLPLQLSLADPDKGILYVFHDDNQRIYKRVPSFPDGLVEVCLVENCRNTRKIHEAARRFFKGGDLRCAGPEGRNIDAVALKPGMKLEQEVERVLRRLRDEKVPADHVAVLVGRTSEKGGLGRNKKIGSIPVTNDQDLDPGKVLLETIHRFKGLENQVVVLADIDGLDGNEAAALYYVGLSRARVYLVVVATPPTLAKLGLAS